MMPGFGGTTNAPPHCDNAEPDSPRKYPPNAAPKAWNNTRAFRAFPFPIRSCKSCAPWRRTCTIRMASNTESACIVPFEHISSNRRVGFISTIQSPYVICVVSFVGTSKWGHSSRHCFASKFNFLNSFSTSAFAYIHQWVNGHDWGWLENVR